jgi:methyl-accepting chemotaxis protein
MFQAITFQTADLKWLVPMIIGALALLGCVAALFRNQSWTLAIIAVLAVGLIGASVFNKVSVTKEGVIIETAQLSAQVLVDLQAAAKSDSDAIGQLTTRVNELATVTQKIAAAQPSGQNHSAELNQISQDAQKIQTEVQQNRRVLQDVGKNSERLVDQLKQLRF